MSKTGIGNSAPKINEKAFPTNLPVRVPHPEGVPTLLVFMGYQTAAKIEPVVSTVRRIVPEPEKLLLINVVDLQNVPRLMHGAAKKIIKAAYDQASTKIPDGYDPQTQLILLTDWRGKIAKAYNVTDVNQAIALVLIDKNGTITHRDQSENPENAAMEMVLGVVGGG